jgi:hypothetical protein
MAETSVNAYKAQLDRMRRDAYAEEWNINGLKLSRSDVMFKVCDWVANGNSLKLFCEQAGSPSVGTIYKWFKNYPEFERDFRAAEEASGHILAETALFEVIHLTESADVPVTKLRYDALTRRAAQMNPRFQDKQVYKQEQDIQSVSDEELKRRRDELYSRVKEELRSEGWVPPANEIDVTVENNELSENQLDEISDYPPDSEVDNPNDDNT